MMQLQRNMIFKLGSQVMKPTENWSHVQTVLTSNQEILVLDVDQKRKT